ncbi:MAG: hypothetical protein E7331_09280 [Clostridiales bacterium]|nr:hypothetical protein [Clostridiales bacterium]
MNMRLLRRTFFVLLLILLPVSVALAQNHNEPFLYLDIPFENISEDQTAELLLKQQGILLEESMVTDYYGYPMELFVNFAPGRNAIDRILLVDAEEIFANEKDFYEYSLRDAEMFVELDRQMTQQYGEPDYRFFVCGGDGRLPPNSRFMFQDGQWSTERLMQVFGQEERTFRAWSVWNNVQLELWVRGFRPTQYGYSNLLTVTYYPEAQGYYIALLDYEPVP